MVPAAAFLVNRLNVIAAATLQRDGFRDVLAQRPARATAAAAAGIAGVFAEAGPLRLAGDLHLVRRIHVRAEVKDRAVVGGDEEPIVASERRGNERHDLCAVIIALSAAAIGVLERTDRGHDIGRVREIRMAREVGNVDAIDIVVLVKAHAALAIGDAGLGIGGDGVSGQIAHVVDGDLLASGGVQGAAGENHGEVVAQQDRAAQGESAAHRVIRQIHRIRRVHRLGEAEAEMEVVQTGRPCAAGRTHQRGSLGVNHHGERGGFGGRQSVDSVRNERGDDASVRRHEQRGGVSEAAAQNNGTFLPSDRENVATARQLDRERGR